jgi:hypothetical protein
MSEQAEALATGGLEDLASFLDNPQGEPTEENEAETVDESTPEEDTEPSTDSEQDDPEALDEPEEEPAPAEKITFKVMGEDGKEEVVEATAEELAKSYLRQQDYTRKTQALAARENEAVQLLTQKHEEIRNQYLSQAELSRAAIVQMAGIRSENEMAELANSDPAAWVAENQRQRQIANYLNSLDQQIQGEKQKAMEQASYFKQQQLQKMYETSWQELSKVGIDKPKLANIYERVSKDYGFSSEELSGVYDHRLVNVLKDAAAYRALKEQKPQVTKKLQDAPRMPNKQIAPAQERRDRELDNRFKSGRAKLNDLAAILR